MEKRRKTETIHIRVEPALKDWLMSYSTRKGMSATAFVTALLQGVMVQDKLEQEERSYERQKTVDQ